MTSIYKKIFWQKYGLFIHAEQMSLKFHHFKEKKRLQPRCFPEEFVKLSRTVVVASENTLLSVIM